MRKKIETRKYKDRAKYNVIAVTKRRKRLKVMAVESRGGMCEICGYKRCIQALDFHHIDESEKEFSLGVRGLTRSWDKILVEINKCILVCANCHREIHAGMVDLSTVSGGIIGGLTIK